MNAAKFITQARKALNKNNVYVSGGFGVLLKGSQLKRYTSNNVYNKEHADEIVEAAKTQPCYGFDCIGLIKAILWGWDATTGTYGGAVYKSNSVPDANPNTFFKKYCTDRGAISTDIVPGSMLWSDGHAAIYIGHGLAIESTQKSGNIRYVHPNGCGTEIKNVPNRTFEKWGTISFVSYQDMDGDSVYIDQNGNFLEVVEDSFHYLNAGAPAIAFPLTIDMVTYVIK